MLELVKLRKIFHSNLLKNTLGFEEMDQQLRVPTAHSEDTSSVPSIHDR